MQLPTLLQGITLCCTCIAFAGHQALSASYVCIQALLADHLLQSALTCLQGTKACLGWDRQPLGGTHAPTAVVDLWLQLLQLSSHVAQVGLKAFQCMSSTMRLQQMHFARCAYLAAAALQLSSSVAQGGLQ